MTWKYFNPVHITFSVAFEAEIRNLLDGEKNVLLMCSDRFRKTGEFDRISNQLGEFRVFSSIEKNPSFQSCQMAIDYVKDSPPDTIVAVGGGSVIDTAKAVRMAIYKSCYDIEKLFRCETGVTTKPLFIAVPTTHGSSSELTMWATIWDKSNKAKHSLSEIANYPDHAIYDAHLVTSLPVPVSISTTLDCLSHSLEALWNKHSNPISDSFAIKAIALIMNNIGRLVEPIPIEVRENLLLASAYAGLAFSNTQTAAAHSISYPLSAYFGIPHGIACSMPLRSLAEINAPKIPDQWAELLKQIHANDFNQLWEQVAEAISEKVPYRLRDYGVKEDDLEWISQLTFTKERMANNVIDLTENDVKGILKRIY